jgi:hypothetical protein
VYGARLRSVEQDPGDIVYLWFRTNVESSSLVRFFRLDIKD